MKIPLISMLWLLLALSPLGAEDRPDTMTLYDIRHEREVSLADSLPRLAESRIILVGEHHSVLSHHEAQLDVIRSLESTGRSVSVGFEMFRSNATPSLDAWVNGQLSEKAFKRIYFDNWNFPWPLYSMLFLHARDAGLPLVGLNVPRDITRQVAKHGFQSLSDQQRERLPMVTCEVDEAYMAFIKAAHGAHGHGGMNFTHFCEAQLVWDKAMAANAVDFLSTRPTTTLVIIAGTGHARKGGIPTRIEEISQMPYTVILPEVPGSIDRGNVTVDDADYLIVGLDPTPMNP